MTALVSEICATGWRVGEFSSHFEPTALHHCVRDVWHTGTHECSCGATYTARPEGFEPPAP